MSTYHNPLNLFLLLYVGFVFSGVVFLAYALPALRMAHKFLWRRALILAGMSIAPIAHGAAGFLAIRAILGLSVDAQIHGMLLILIVLVPTLIIVFISLLQGLVFCKVTNDPPLLRLFIRNGLLACLLLFGAFMPFFSVKLSKFYEGLPLPATVAIAVCFLALWHALLALGLLRWAKNEHRGWQVRNELCVHCQYNVRGLKGELCPECGETCRAW